LRLATDATSSARCGKAGKPRQLNELLKFDEDESVIVLCNQCVHSLRYADSPTWKWFRDHRDRLSQNK
jgi:hypothetical protein